MEKTLTVTPPEGYVIDEKKSTFEHIVFKPKCLTYKDVCKNLFTCFSDSSGNLLSNFAYPYINEFNNCTSLKQIKKLSAINKLLNTAKYLNGDWQPDWSVKERKYSIVVDPDNFNVNVIMVYGQDRIIGHMVYFKTNELAKQAIEILGEDTIRLAYSTDY